MTEVDKLLEMCDRASPGPWLYDAAEVRNGDGQVIVDSTDGIQKGADGVFIAAARTLLPWALARIKQLEQANRSLQREALNLEAVHARWTRQADPMESAEVGAAILEMTRLRQEAEELRAILGAWAALPEEVVRAWSMEEAWRKTKDALRRKV
jgi:hypothetical protein